ncbi:MAG: hypothetical protein RPR97_00985 [Colwellia sp.]
MSVFIACDFLMTREETQDYHLRWVFDLYRRPIEWSVGVRPTRFLSGEKKGFSREKFFSLSGIECMLDEIHFWYEDYKISDKSIAYLRRHLKGCEILVGYEMSLQTRTLLDRANINYIDIWLHPVRFMDDNLYAFRSNNSQINKEVFNFNLSEKFYYVYADRMKIVNYRGWDRKYAKLDKQLNTNSALFIGQTLSDKAVCRDGNMLTLLDFKKEFKAATKKFGQVYYSRHPMLRGEDTEIIDYVKSFSNASLIEAPAYNLLCCDAIKYVFSVSSSLVAEAKYFDKETHILYRPVIKVGDKDDGEIYSSIYQNYIDPSFWSKILSPILKTADVEKIQYFETERKSRDMLSLYYNSHAIDKVDDLKKKIDELEHKLVRLEKREVTPKNIKVKSITIDGPNAKSVEGWKSRVSEYDVISFDIFDTLLERSLNKPSDIYALLTMKAAELTNGGVNEFGELRRMAKTLVPEIKGEVTLGERYGALTPLISNDYPDFLDIMYKYELDLEARLLKPKGVGVLLFEFAKKQGKKVVLTSDTYFDELSINRFLNVAKIDLSGVDLLLSSTERATKESGGLYDSLRAISGGKKLLHIGDNKKVDLFNAKSKGVEALYIPSGFDVAKSITKSYPYSSADILASITSGLFTRKISAYPAIMSAPGFYRGNKEELGYNVVAPFIFRFAKYIVEYGVENELKEIFFLARDGEIVKKAYDLIAQYYPNAPSSKYLLTSRRAIKVASYTSVEIVKSELELVIQDQAKNPSPTTYKKFIEMRFGVIVNDDFNKLISPYDIKSVVGKLSLDAEFLSMVVSESAKRKDKYITYCNDLGVVDGMCVVDIGHNGSMQCLLSNMLGLNKSTGLYFVTYEKVDEALSKLSGQHKAIGFYADRESPTNKSNEYVKNALLFEALFLNEKGTFKGFDVSSSEQLPEYESVESERRRVIFNRDIHEGVVKYTKDVLNILGDDLSYVSLDNTLSIDVASRLFDLPTVRDAEAFKEVVLENYFGGRSVRYLVPPTKSGVSGALWKKGTEMFYGKEVQQKTSIDSEKKERGSSGVVVDFLVKTIVDDKKYRKFKRNPRQFFFDSKSNVIKTIGSVMLKEK